MIYVTENFLDNPRVWCIRDIPGYIEVASHALQRRGVEAPGTIKELLEVCRSVYDHYEVYVTPWHAADALKSGNVREEYRTDLAALLSRHERVNARPYMMGA